MVTTERRVWGCRCSIGGRVCVGGGKRGQAAAMDKDDCRPPESWLGLRKGRGKGRSRGGKPSAAANPRRRRRRGRWRVVREGQPEPSVVACDGDSDLGGVGAGAPHLCGRDAQPESPQSVVVCDGDCELGVCGPPVVHVVDAGELGRLVHPEAAVHLERDEERERKGGGPSQSDRGA